MTIEDELRDELAAKADASSVYRYPTPLPVGFLARCPQCGAQAYRCAGCHCVTTAADRERAHCFTNTGSGSDGGYWNFFADRPEPILNFDRGTGRDRYCSPERRVRYGFLWLTICSEPGVHVHQRCERCGWRGISIVDPTVEEG
jgi:hypothetical protein